MDCSCERRAAGTSRTCGEGGPALGCVHAKHCTKGRSILQSLDCRWTCLSRIEVLARLKSLKTATLACEFQSSLRLKSKFCQIALSDGCLRRRSAFAVPRRFEFEGGLGGSQELVGPDHHHHRRGFHR